MTTTHAATTTTSTPPTFPDRCFALSQEQTRRAAGCSGQRQVYRQLLAYGFYTAGLSLQYLRDVDSHSLPAAPVRPDGGYDRDLAVRWQAQAERGDLQGAALWLATFAYEREWLADEREWLADGARNAGPADEAEALFFSRWQDDLCHRESGALQRLAELLDPELAEQLRSEEQEIPADV